MADDIEQGRTKMRMLGRIATTIIGTRIAAETGKAGLVGAAAGMLATRVLTRSPLGAIAIGGAYVAHKLWQKKKEIDKKGPHETAVEDGLITDGRRKNGHHALAPLKTRVAYRKSRPKKPVTRVTPPPAIP
ncbi:MAG TPA: hypothetical protein VF509_06025 [Sphingobium sp.]